MPTSLSIQVFQSYTPYSPTPRYKYLSLESLDLGSSLKHPKSTLDEITLKLNLSKSIFSGIEKATSV